MEDAVAGMRPAALRCRWRPPIDRRHVAETEAGRVGCRGGVRGARAGLRGGVCPGGPSAPGAIIQAEPQVRRKAAQAGVHGRELAPHGRKVAPQVLQPGGGCRPAREVHGARRGRGGVACRRRKGGRNQG